MSVLRFAAFVCLLLVGGPSAWADDSSLSLPQVAVDAVEYLNGLHAQFGTPDATKSAAALKEAIAKQGRNDAAGAVASYERAVALGDEQTDTLMALSQALTRVNRWRDAASAAWLAYLGSDKSDAVVKKTLLALGAALERQGRLREALATYQGLNNVTYDEFAAGRITALRDATDFRVVATSTSASGDSPQACLEFRRPPSSDKAVELSDYIKVEPKAPTTLSISESKLCIGGLDYGTTYKITVLKGLPGADAADKLAASDTIAIDIGDRDPSVGFRSSTYVLPKDGPLGVPVTTVNVDRLKLRLLRIGDRNIVRQLQNQRFLLGLDRYEADQIVDQTGEELWHGEMNVVVEPNKRVVTSVPIDQFLKTTQPGIYLLTATSAASSDEYGPVATQWLVVTDIGLTTLSGSDGLHAFARSLDTGKPIAGLELRLYGINNDQLGSATTDANGVATFAAGLLRGTAGKAPAAVMAFATSGDFTILDLTRAAFDLSDRGVGGRPAPGANDLFFYTDRGVYRPGETVHLVGLLRDDGGRAIDNLPLTLRLMRPDAVQAREIVLTSGGAGGYTVDLPMTPTAQTGTWTVQGFVDPAGQPVATASFLVEEVVPARIEVKLKSDVAALKDGETASVDLSAMYLYGAPAGGLPIGGDVTIKLDDDPFPALAGYRFGLVDEKVEPARTDLEAAETGDDGSGSIAVAATNLPDTPQPLQAVLRAEVFEFGGRPVVQTLKLPIRNQKLYLGIKPGFANDSVAENSEAGFDVVAVDPAGTAVALPKAKYRLVREEWDYQWYYRNSAWDYEVVVRDAGSTNGEIAIAADKPARVAENVQWGPYRLEVYDEASGAAASYRFEAGWAAAPGLGDTPDRLQVTADQKGYRVGQTAKVLIKSPFAGEVLMTIATNKVVETRSLTVTAEGTVVDVPIDGAWGAGAYVLATAFRPGTNADKRGPGRAIGVAWLGIDPAERRLDVAIKAPPVIEPRHPVDIPLEVAGLTAGQSAYVTLAAVDEGVLQLTDFATPQPQVWFFGKRRLGVEVRDLYGQLIDGRLGRRGEIRTGGDEGSLGRRGAPPQIKLVALFSGIVKLDDQGRTTIRLDVPDYNGRLRLMAIAWDKDKVGAADFGMIVRDPVVALTALPRFLAPGDRSQAAVTLQNVSGPTGVYHLSVAAEGTLAVDGGAPLAKRLEVNQTATLTVPLLGKSAGEGTVIVSLRGPDDFAIDRRIPLTVRPAQLATVQRLVRKLDPGEGLTLSGAALDSFLAGTGELMARFSDRPSLDVPGLLQTLERYPYGCMEQTVSRAMPLLYVNEVAQAWGITNDPAASPEAMQRTITRVLEMQRYDGSFGLWDAHGDTEPWLTSFAMDFLTRAQERGLKVSSTAYANGLKWLVGHSQSYRDDTPSQLASRAYAFYVLAKARSGDLGALRYLFDNYGSRVPSGLADAQMGAAFALYGDQPRAAAAFKLALDRVERRNYEADDYGTLLRDLAAIATLMLETKGSGQNPAGVLQRVAALQAQASWLSTQEETWMLLAAHAAVGIGSGGMTLAVAGDKPQQMTQTLYLRPTREQLGRGVTVRNAGTNAVFSGETLIGNPAKDLPAATTGFTLARQFFTLDGTATKLDKVKQSDVFVVVLRGKMLSGAKRRAMLIDLLPAGFEVENARLAGSRGSEQLGWLGDLTKTRYSEYLDDRFVAAFDLDRDNQDFAVAYLVRAVTPGTYRQPAAHVEDMYDPATRARTTIGSVTVRPFK
jgi:uncharacterized protein YfaS (alpha-2-macroglobulin family)